jgi:hypothetical protein
MIDRRFAAFGIDTGADNRVRNRLTNGAKNQREQSWNS